MFINGVFFISPITKDKYGEGNCTMKLVKVGFKAVPSAFTYFLDKDESQYIESKE